MISETAKQRTKILAFWEQYGDKATKDAFGVSRPTLYRWQKAIREGHGKLDALNKQSTAPKRRRKRVIPEEVKTLILAERSREKIGKEKLAVLLEEDGIAELSSSTVGRMLGDMKREGLLPDPVRHSLFGKTGNMIERKPRAYKRKLRSKGHEGGLVKADTIVRFTNGIKRYVLTGIDRESKFTFAYGYTSHSSKPARDFMEKFKHVAPLSLTHVQTDNGSEFAEHFEAYLKKEGIVHFHAYPRTPKMQSEIERFNRTLSEAFIQQNRHVLAYDLDAFNEKLMDWLVWYNTRRPHWSLGLVSPLRYIVSTLPAKESQMWWTRTWYRQRPLREYNECINLGEGLPCW